MMVGEGIAVGLEDVQRYLRMNIKSRKLSRVRFASSLSHSNSQQRQL